MDPLQKAQNEGMPTSTTKTLDLTEDQRAALFGEDKECAPGEMYTIQLRAGDLSEGGQQTFEVVPKEAEEEDESEGEGEESMSTLPPAEEPMSNEAEVAALGYDRAKFAKKKPAPKISARDLEYD